MKKLLVLLLAMMMVLSLAACGGGNDTPDPSGSNGSNEQQTGGTNDNNGESNGNSSGDDKVSTDWYTKPFYVKGTAYDGTEPDGEMVMLYDGTELIVWNGDNGDYGYFDGDTLMAMVLGREGDNISVIYNGEPVATTMQQYMENEVDFLGGIIWYLENMSDYSNKGSEKIGNFDCIKYESEPDAIGLSYTFWVDKATGVFVKEQSVRTKDWDGSDLDEPEVNILYIVDSISVTNVPTVTSVYSIPEE